MPTRPSALALAALLVALGAARPLGAAEGSARGFAVLLADVERDRPAIEPRFDADGLPVLDTRLEPRLDAHRLGLLVGLGGELEPTPGVVLFAALDTGLLAVEPATDPAPTRTFADEAAETWLIRALGVELFADDGRAWSLVVGKQRLQLARGMLVDTPALGVDAALADALLGLRIGAWWPGRRALPEGWPLLRAEVEWRPDLFVSTRLFAASTRFDGARAQQLIDPLVQSTLLRRVRTVLEGWLTGDDPPGDGDLQIGGRIPDAVRRLADCAGYTAAITPWWLGAEFEALLDGHTLAATALVGGGAVRIAPDIDPACPRLAALADRLVPTRGFGLAAAGFDARWRMRLAPSLYAGAFALGMTGHDGDVDLTRIDTFTALLAPAPLLTRPGLFFDGGLGADLGERPAVAYGYAGRGVLAGGPVALWVPHPAVELDLLFAPLWSAAARDGERFYGYEADATLRWQPLDALVVRGQIAALWPGRFFAAGGPWWRAGVTIEAVGP